jgi:hypothetical protein
MRHTRSPRCACAASGHADAPPNRISSCVPAGRGGPRGPVRCGGSECLAIGHKLLPPMQRHISRCSREVETGNAPDPLQIGGAFF